MNVVRLKVKVTERSTKDGRKFNSYTTYSKNGRRTDLKFRKEVPQQMLPVKDCFIVCDVDNVNVNTFGEYPVCWVSAIERIDDLGAVNAEKNVQQVKDYFGE